MGKRLVKSDVEYNVTQTLTRNLCAALAIAAMASTHAATVISPKENIQEAFKAALFCEREALDARDKQTFIRLTSENVKIRNDEDGNPIDFVYQFEHPIIIAGVPVTKVRYVGDSGSLFLAFAKGDINSFAGLHRAIPVRKTMKIDVGWGTGKFYRYAAKPTKSNPYPDVFFVGREKNMKPDEFTFGCQEYDY